MQQAMPEQDIILTNENEVSVNLIQSLLEKNHCSCVQLYERFSKYLQQDKKNYCGKFICFTNLEKTKLYGIVFASNAGLILHCFSTDLTKPVVLKIINLLSDFLTNRNIYCVSGEITGTNLLALAIKTCGKFSAPVEQRKYTLMEFNHNLSTISNNFIQVENCKETQLEELLPLQSHYDQVEVLPPNQPFNLDLCKKNLTKALQQKRVFGIRFNNEIIAKASINAATNKYWQIGGVFTKQDCRGKGCASNLTNHIATQALSLGIKTVLFVRKGNTPAEKAYNKAGFRPIGNYEIIYY